MKAVVFKFNVNKIKPKREASKCVTIWKDNKIHLLLNHPNFAFYIKIKKNDV